MNCRQFVNITRQFYIFLSHLFDRLKMNGSKHKARVHMVISLYFIKKLSSASLARQTNFRKWADTLRNNSIGYIACD